MEHDPLNRLYEKAYGQQNDASRVQVALRLLKKSVQFQSQQILRVLDVGGGDMKLARIFADRLSDSFGVQIELEGWDLSAEGVRQAHARGEKSRLRSICDPVEADEVGKYDLILFFEVLEHLVDTDTAMVNLKKLLKSGGWLLLSTPNLAGWVDRLSLLFGLQPHAMEVSFVPIQFGNPLARRLLPRGPGDVVAGHLRVFTLRALKEFLYWHGIRPVRISGCVNHSFDFVTPLFARWWPGIVGNVVVLGTPSTEKQSSPGMRP